MTTNHHRSVTTPISPFSHFTTQNNHPLLPAKGKDLMEWDEGRGSGGTDTRATVGDRFVSDREFTEVATDHGGLDFDDVKMFSVVDGNNGANHVGQDNHVAKVRLHWRGLLMRSLGLCSQFGSSQLLCKTIVLSSHTTLGATTALTSIEHLYQLAVRQVNQLIKINTTVGEFLERALLLQLGISLCGGLFGHSGNLFGIGEVFQFPVFSQKSQTGGSQQNASRKTLPKPACSHLDLQFRVSDPIFMQTHTSKAHKHHTQERERMR